MTVLLMISLIPSQILSLETPYASSIDFMTDAIDHLLAVSSSSPSPLTKFFDRLLIA